MIKVNIQCFLSGWPPFAWKLLSKVFLRFIAANDKLAFMFSVYR